MARIYIKNGAMKVSKAGYDPRTATARDHFLLNTDFITDQVIAEGAVAFSGDTAVASVPSGYGNYKLDFYYCELSGGTVERIWLPDKLTMTDIRQLTAVYGSGSITFTRSGNLSGEGSRGVRYVLYSSPNGGPASGPGSGVPRTWITAANGLRISLPGYDVTTAAPGELSFDSSRPMPWLWASGSGTIPANTIGTLSFPGVLDEPPLPFVALRVGGGRIQVGMGAATVEFSPPTPLIHYGTQFICSRTSLQIANALSTSQTFDYQLYRLR